jgi:hypothetical protein
VLVPKSSVLVGADVGAVTCMVGFSRGSRDATTMTLEALSHLHAVPKRDARPVTLKPERTGPTIVLAV